VEAMESFKKFAGTMIPPATYGKNERGGSNAAFIMRADVQAKKFVPLTGWMTADLVD
jgi:hypothetical protein